MTKIEANIRYVLGKEELLDRIGALWEELNILHCEKSPHFKDFYANYTFQARKDALLSTAQKGQLCVVLACNGDFAVGYCVASVVDDVGEIDSIFVSGDYRKRGIASNLMDQALNWLKQSKPKRMVIKVSAGNEEVYGFYAKYGFYPCLTELQMPPDSCKCTF